MTYYLYNSIYILTRHRHVCT